MRKKRKRKNCREQKIKERQGGGLPRHSKLDAKEAEEKELQGAEDKREAGGGLLGRPMELFTDWRRAANILENPGLIAERHCNQPGRIVQYGFV
jgi:hypothetical protein